MVAIWKQKEVENLAEKIKSSKVVGLVSITNIPSRQFQRIRKSLKDKVELRVARLNLMKRAFKKAGVSGLESYLTSPLGLIFSKELNVFQLKKLLDNNKSTAPAKPGSVAPNDIVIPKGDTPFAPGPIIGELQNVGIKAAIEGGKIVVKEDSVVAKKGEVISPEVANVLSRFGIEPMKIGFDLKVAFED